ncbi:MAG: WD40 repeat domain-containing serine/threonine protein kinase, partial [Blastocatellia bacterium]
MLASDTILQNRYRILRLLGQGGMGAVYLAEDRRFGSRLALKEALFDQPRLRRAFEREAKLLHQLRHPALPVVMDYFTEGQGQY